MDMPSGVPMDPNPLKVVTAHAEYEAVFSYWKKNGLSSTDMTIYMNEFNNMNSRMKVLYLKQYKIKVP